MITSYFKVGRNGRYILPATFYQNFLTWTGDSQTLSFVANSCSVLYLRIKEKLVALFIDQGNR